VQLRTLYVKSALVAHLQLFTVWITLHIAVGSYATYRACGC